MKKQVKMLKLPSSVDEYAYMFALDYCAMVQGVSEKQQVSTACYHKADHEQPGSSKKQGIIYAQGQIRYLIPWARSLLASWKAWF